MKKILSHHEGTLRDILAHKSAQQFTMLYLAKISRQEDTGEMVLQLLARQKSEHYWVIASGNSPTVSMPDDAPYGYGSLVLVEVSRDRQVKSMEDATDWILNLVNQYLNTGVTPEFLHQEAARAEECRKDLTLKNQDMARRALELETRRDQIQELEKKLELERQQLEAMRARVDPNSLQVAETGESPDIKQNPSVVNEIEDDNHTADVIQP